MIRDCRYTHDPVPLPNLPADGPAWLWIRGVNRWRLATWLVGLVMASALWSSLLAIPVQRSDSVVPLLQAQEFPTVLEAVRASANNSSYFRPLRIWQIQVLYQWADGQHYFLVFRGFHVLLVAALFASFVAVLRVDSALDFLVAALAMTVLVGHHAFLGTVWEAYPINHFLEVCALCVFALVLARSRGGWWVDLLAMLTFALAALTLESGLLVCVVLWTAWLVGWRGVSRRALVVVGVLLCVYFYARFGYFETGLPGLDERESGFWTTRLSPVELRQRFGADPRLFYAYNVVASLLGVLFAEPRGGLYSVPLQIERGLAIAPATYLTIGTSFATTACIGWFMWRHAREWVRGRFDDAGRLVCVALAVIGANAAISYGYTKDEIMSPGSVFYAIAAYASVREVVAVAARRAEARRRHVLLALVLLLVGCGWSVRTVGTHYNMHVMAFTMREHWVDVDRWLDEQGVTPKNDGQRRLIRVLRDDAIGRTGIQPKFLPQWAARWFQ